MKRIFMTGASGCIGHYMAESLIQHTDHELFLLVRDPAKLRFDTQARPGIHLVQGDLLDIERQASLLKTMDGAILAATAWGGAQESFETNVSKTQVLINSLDPDRCEQVIYFSTASILGRDHHPLPEAGELGTDYVRTKYQCFQTLKNLALAPKITVLFPTLVAGGDPHKPYSHFTGGIRDLIKWAGLVRWFRADGSFHFIHSYDIAQVVTYLVQHPPAPSPLTAAGELQPDRLWVLGNEPWTVDQAIGDMCAYVGKRIYFQINLNMTWANFFIKVFRIQMAAWDRFCLRYRHFRYENPINPRTLGLESFCPTLTDVLRTAGVPRGGDRSHYG